MVGKCASDELAELRGLVKRLESGELTICQNDQDVTKREIGPLKRQITYLENVLGGASVPKRWAGA
jgi:hypothetical protein